MEMTNVQYTYQLHGLTFIFKQLAYVCNNPYTFVSEQASRPSWQEKWYAVSGTRSVSKINFLIFISISDLSTQLNIHTLVCSKKDIQPLEEVGIR